ncbi:MAG: DUF2147 domain-containing protein [Rhodobacteraceae bacterium]|nr:DUF2147 domain-containing protein [Paracoccaceae bacterium]
MRPRLTALATAGALVLALAPAGAAADPIIGTWQTTPGEEGGFLHVEMAPCGARFCGTIVKAVNGAGEVGRDYAHLGKLMIRDMRADGDGRYSGGQIWAPDEDKTYGLRLRLTEAGLAVRGCVLGFCRDAGVWVRVD